MAQDVLNNDFTTMKRDLFWDNSQLTKYKDLTHHELYHLHGGLVDIYDVPTIFHRSIGHCGGTKSVSEIWAQLGSNSLFLPERMTARRSILDIAFDLAY